MPTSPERRESKSEVARGAASQPEQPNPSAGALLEPTDDDWFEDRTARSGVDFAYQNGQASEHFFILESLGGGCALFDFDGDGDLDLFCTGGGTIGGSPATIAGLPSALYRNEGDWRFVDVTPQSGLTGAAYYSHGCSIGDFDCDGWPDVLVCGYGGSQLWHNNTDGTFRDDSLESGLNLDGWNTAAAWADFDRDGLPDLCIVRYLAWSPESDRSCRNRHGQREVCSPRMYPSTTDGLFRNRGDGTFENRTEQAALTRPGNGLGVVASDLNQDGFLDLYVANDETDNRLYMGGPGMRFTERGLISGVATNEYGMPEGSMGVDASDYDGDGDLDLWVTNFESEDNALYRNYGDGTFTQTTVVTGLAGHSRPLVGFGTGFADFDLDGWLDVFVVNGHVFYGGGQSSYAQPAQLFRNQDGKRFQNVSPQGGTYLRTPHVARGASVGDLDNDGAMDLVVVHQNSPVALLRNRKVPQAFLRVRLVGTRSDRLAAGATVTATYQGRQVLRAVRSGAGYFSHFDQRAVFPVSGDQLVSVRVVWPDGTRESFAGLGSGTTHTLIEGHGEPQASP